MLVLSPWPDPDVVLRLLLADLVTQEVVRVLPPNLEEVLPLIRARRVGGADDRVTDRPRMDVEVYAPTAAIAKPLAERVRQRMLAGAAATSAGVMDRAFTEVGPRELSYPNPAVRLFAATYRISLRRRWS